MDDDAVELYGAGLMAGSGQLETSWGSTWPLPIGVWRAEPDCGDQLLLARCTGPTLDVGCGPGRMTAELSRRGMISLGVDVSEVAVAMTRARGGSALCRDVFGVVLGERRWQHVLLADGNVGIGGDPVRMLARCRELIGPAGSVLVDLAPPGSGLRVGRVRLVAGDRVSGWFDWAWLGVDVVAVTASAAGLGVRAIWSAPTATGPRWQAELERADCWPRP